MVRSLHGHPARFPDGLHDIADGVLVWLAPNGGWGESNAAVIVGDGQAALVDTLFTPALTGRMLSAVDARIDVPIRTVINTHADGDHTWGNELVAGAAIIATTATAERMRRESPVRRQRERLTAGALRRLPGVGTVGAYVHWMLAPYEFAGIALTFPTRTFSGQLMLEVGERMLHLEDVGPAHTAGDLIVHVPDADVVIAGDVVFSGVHPVMWAAPTARWVEALRRIEALRPRVVVPGHGPLGSLDEVRQLRRYLEWLEPAARAGLERGSSPREVALALIRSDEFRAAPWGDWEGPERMVITIAAIDRCRRGRGEVSGRERALLLAAAASVARELGQPPFSGAPAGSPGGTNSHSSQSAIRR